MVDCVDRLYAELANRGLRLRPPCWFAEEWFCADGSAGIGIPFYLAHPRLRRLERRQMREVIGGGTAWCMRLLRHEAGHAIDNAFRLRRRKEYRELFGRPSVPYPTTYRPRTRSRDHVLHLGYWYAQSHPCEDFAETFAVWLASPRSWCRRYRGWPAVAKLEYVDRLMAQLAGKTPAVRSRRHVWPITQATTTLREHYEAKTAYWKTDPARHLDAMLRRLVGDTPHASRGTSLVTLIQRAHARLRQHPPYQSFQARYALDQVAADLAWRSRRLRLAVDPSRNRTIMSDAKGLLLRLAARYRARFHEVLV